MKFKAQMKIVSIRIKFTTLSRYWLLPYLASLMHVPLIILIAFSCTHDTPGVHCINSLGFFFSFPRRLRKKKSQMALICVREKRRQNNPLAVLMRKVLMRERKKKISRILIIGQGPVLVSLSIQHGYQQLAYCIVLLLSLRNNRLTTHWQL